jgi:magnesium chelatase family protein
LFASLSNVFLKQYLYIEFPNLTLMLVQIFGSAVYGIDAHPITLEVNIDKGIGYHLVGLPDNAIKDSNYRIAAALQNIGYKLPGKKITIKMAPEINL